MCSLVLAFPQFSTLSLQVISHFYGFQLHLLLTVSKWIALAQVSSLSSDSFSQLLLDISTWLSYRIPKLTCPSFLFSLLNLWRLLFSSQLGKWLCCSPCSSYLNPEVSFDTTASLHLRSKKSSSLCDQCTWNPPASLHLHDHCLAQGSLSYCLCYFTDNSSC